ncbi:MAG: glutathione S-transferase family protein [bacterium]|nr:glutathione S-transferase family protein [bacterium]
MNSLKLISFDLCPFVQRSVILLKEKGLDFEVEYIDLANKPEWFLKISPLGKVPVLQVGATILFESAVIAEYLDEISPPSAHPKDPLVKAQNRAWIEFSSSLLGSQFMMCCAEDAAGYKAKLDELRAGLSRLDAQLKGGPFFNGEKPHLIDFCIAPLFQRMELIERRGGPTLTQGMLKLRHWSQNLLERNSVQDSVPQGFEDKFVEYLKSRGGHLAGLIR